MYHQPAIPWGDYAHPREGIAELLEQELRRFERKGDLDGLAILMSSVTDPYLPLERRWNLSRACLEAFGRHRPALVNVQTRSPLVERDFDLMKDLGERCWLNFTLETDLEEVRRSITPRCPPVSARLRLLKAARDAGINVQVTVSPCLPFSSVESFGTLLLELGDKVVVDTYTTGDGQRGRRTATTRVPSIYAGKEWGDWRAEERARALYSWLHDRTGDRAGWSQQGFARLAIGTRKRAAARDRAG